MWRLFNKTPGHIHSSPEPLGLIYNKRQKKKKKTMTGSGYENNLATHLAMVKPPRVLGNALALTKKGNHYEVWPGAKLGVGDRRGGVHAAPSK